MSFSNGLVKVAVSEKQKLKNSFVLAKEVKNTSKYWADKMRPHLNDAPKPSALRQKLDAAKRAKKK